MLQKLRREFLKIQPSEEDPGEVIVMDDVQAIRDEWMTGLWLCSDIQQEKAHAVYHKLSRGKNEFLPGAPPPRTGTRSPLPGCALI